MMKKTDIFEILIHTLAKLDRKIFMFIKNEKIWSVERSSISFRRSFPGLFCDWGDPRGYHWGYISIEMRPNLDQYCVKMVGSHRNSSFKDRSHSHPPASAELRIEVDSIIGLKWWWVPSPGTLFTKKTPEMNELDRGKIFMKI